MKDALIRYWRAKRYPQRPSTNGTLYGVNTFEPPYLVSHANVISTATALGVQVIRCGITWSNMQTTVGGSIDWTEFDSIYAKCIAANITPIFVLETTPIAYNTTPHGFFSGTPSVLAIPTVTDPKFTTWVTDQAAWAAQVAARYPLALFEWWNEWATASGYWKENDSGVAKPTISAWVTAYNACYAAMKAANPACTVAVGGLTDLTHWFGANATVGVEALRILMQTYSIVTDAFSIHPYTGDTSDPNPALDHYGPFGATGFANSYDDIARCQQMIVSCGYGNTPLWVTEWGNYSAAAVGGESVKAGYVTYSFNKINKLYSAAAVGPGKAGVTIATFYPLIDASFSPTDTGLVGPNGNGPYTAHASGTAYQAFMASLPSVTPVLTSIVISGPSSVIAAHSTTAYTAVGLDQFKRVISMTPTFHSSNGNATIGSSSGIATGVSAGSSNITATSGAITSNTIALTVSAQVATSPIAVSPSSFTISTIGGTQALAAVVSDQGSPANVIAGASVSWSSGTPANATVNSSTGVVTAVANGSATITATSGSATGTSAATVSAGGTVTSIDIFYNSAATNQMLLETGTTYQLTPKDQAGNTLSNGSGTWASADATNFPVNSSGLISPATGVSGGAVTFTHTASGVVGTVLVSVIKTPTWALQERVTYANDAALRNNIGSGVTTGSVVTPPPTGGGGALYKDGLNEGGITLDSTRKFMGNQSLLMTFLTGGGDNGTGGVPDLAAFYTGGVGVLRAMMVVVKRYDPGFTILGGGSGGSSYKDGPFMSNSGIPGRAGVVYTNVTDIVTEALQLSAGGPDETMIGSETTEWSDGLWYCDIVLYQGVSNLQTIQVWRFKVGTNPLSATLLPTAPIWSPALLPGFTPMPVDTFSPFGKNYNKSVTTALYKSIGFWGAVDGVIYGDPLGIINDATTPTLTGISGGTLTHGTTGNTVTLTGTNFTSNCYPTFSNAGVLLQALPTISGGGTTMTLTVNVTSGAGTGAGTVSVTNYSSQHTTSTQAVLIL